MFFHRNFTKLVKGTTITVDGKQLVFVCHLANGQFHFVEVGIQGMFLAEGEDGQRHIPNSHWLNLLLSRDDVVIDVPGKDDRAPAPFELVNPLLALDAAQAENNLKGFDRAFLLRVKKIRWLEIFDANPAPKSKDGLRDFIEQNRNAAQLLGLGTPPSASALRNWINNIGVPGNRSLDDAISMRGRAPRVPYHGKLAVKVMNKAREIYWADRKIDGLDAYAYVITILGHLNDRAAGIRKVRDPKTRKLIEVARKFPSARKKVVVPSQATFYRSLTKSETFDNVASRLGMTAAKARMNGCDEGLEASRILEICVLDHSGWDTILVDENGVKLGRPTLCVMLDVYSRCVVGWYLSWRKPSLETALETIKRASRFKAHLLERFPDRPDLPYVYGKGHELVLDHGIEVGAASFRTSMFGIGTSLRFVPIAEPKYKAKGERFFGILKQMSAHKVPGAVFLSAEEMRNTPIDPMKEACFTIKQMESLVEEAISDYHYNINRILGRSRISMWLESAAAHGIQTIDDLSQLDLKLGKHVRRTLRPNGIEYEGAQYGDQATVSELLRDLVPGTPQRRGRRKTVGVPVTVVANLSNMGSLSIYNPVRKAFMSLPAKDRSLEGISLETHKAMRARQRELNEEFDPKENRWKRRYNFRKSIDREIATSKYRDRARLAAIKEGIGPGAPGCVVEIAYAEATPDGQAFAAPSVEMDAYRKDGGRNQPTAPRGGSRRRRAAATQSAEPKPKPQPKPSKAPDASAAYPDLTDPDAFLSALNWADAA